MANVGFPVASAFMMEDCYTAGGWKVPVMIDAAQGVNVTVYVKLNSGTFTDLPGAPAALNTPAGTPITIPAGSQVGYLTLPTAPNNATVGANANMVFGIASVSGGHAIGGTLQTTLTITYYDDDTGGALRPCVTPMFSDTPVCTTVSLFNYAGTSIENVSGPGAATLVGSNINFVAGGTPGISVWKVINAQGYVHLVVMVTGSPVSCDPMTVSATPTSVGCGQASALVASDYVGTVTWSVSPSGLGTLASVTGSSNTFTATSLTASGTATITITDQSGQTASVQISVVCTSGAPPPPGGVGTAPCGECPAFICSGAMSSCDIRDNARTKGLYFGNPLPTVIRSEGYGVSLTTAMQQIYALPNFATSYTFVPGCNEIVRVDAIIHIARGAGDPSGANTQDPIETRIIVNGQTIAFDYPVFNHVGSDPRVYMPLSGLFVALGNTAYTIAVQARNTVAARWQISLRSIIVERSPYR